MTLTEYVKCAWTNKITRYSYLLGILSLSSATEYENNTLLAASFVSGLASIGLGYTSRFGTETYRSYKCTKAKIKKYGEPHLTYNELFALYCNRAGMNLAVSEANMNDVLNEAYQFWGYEPKSSKSILLKNKQNIPFAGIYTPNTP
jgi:hypothetical protein